MCRGEAPRLVLAAGRAPRGPSATRQTRRREQRGAVSLVESTFREVETQQGSGLDEVADETTSGGGVLLTRLGQPIAAVISMQKMRDLEERVRAAEELADDLAEVTLLLTRLAGDTGGRTSLDDVLEEFGYSREELLALDDDDDEDEVSDAETPQLAIFGDASL